MNDENISDLTSLHHFGKKLAKRLIPGSVVLLDGPLGVGKTTLCQVIARALGVLEPLTSPSYTLIQDYQGRLPVFHMDLYRLSGEEEFELIGGREYFDRAGVCLVEWGGRLNVAPQVAQLVEITMEFSGNARRIFWQEKLP